jgi:hypothetical protein
MIEMAWKIMRTVLEDVHEMESLRETGRLGRLRRLGRLGRLGYCKRPEGA